jgi:hypothetical protein
VSSVVRTGSHRRRAVLSPEVLEDRTTPAGNVTAFVSGGVLHITGDAQANHISVTALGDDLAIVAPLDNTTINGMHAPLVFGDIKFSYSIQLGAGNDAVNIFNVTGDIAVLVDTGADDDRLALMLSEHGGATVLNTGSGDDILAVGMCELNSFTSVNVGAGDNNIDIGGGEFGSVVFTGGGGLNSMSVVGVNFTSTPLLFGFDRVYGAHMPLARNDSARVGQNGRVTINVAGNDSANAGTIDLTSIRITEQPEHGRARVNADGTITYTVEDEDAESDSFKYTIRNSLGVESNAATVSLRLTAVPDTTGPRPTITSTVADLNNVSPIPFKVTFNEDVTGFAVGDIEVTNGTVVAGSFVAVNAREFTFDVTPTANGDVTVSIEAGAAEDEAGNDSVAASKTVVSDRTAPTPTISSTASNPTSVSPIPMVVEFSEDMRPGEFVLGDISVTGGTPSNLALDNTTPGNRKYTFIITPSGDGEITVNIAATIARDLAGNQNAAAQEFTITFDDNAPSVDITTPATSPTDLSPIPFTATFSEPVTDFIDTDITVTNGTVGNFAGSGANYTFEVTPTGDGDVTVTINANVAEDASGNGNTSDSFTITSDRTAPVPTVSSSESGTTSLNPIPFTVTFSEAVTGFTAGDIAVDNGGVTNFSGSGTTYTFDVVPTAAGTVNVSVGPNVSEDAATNGNAASNTFTIEFTGAVVTTTITGPTGPTNLDPIPITVTFSEDVTGFDATDLNITNGTATNFAGSGASYTFDLVPTADGSIAVTVPAGAATAAGGRLTSTDEIIIASDRTNPTVAVNSSGTGVITGTSSDSSDVTGVDVSIFNGTNFWDGDGFDSATEEYFPATSSDNFATWSLAFTTPGTYTVHARATDAAGNLGEVTNNAVTVE